MSGGSSEGHQGWWSGPPEREADTITPGLKLEARYKVEKYNTTI